jgi:peptide subunit release factor 1 (eRF1)
MVEAGLELTHTFRTIAAEVLANVKFIKEKKLIAKYFDEVSLDSGRFCFGVSETMKALEMGKFSITCISTLST